MEFITVRLIWVSSVSCCSCPRSCSFSLRATRSTGSTQAHRRHRRKRRGRLCIRVSGAGIRARANLALMLGVLFCQGIARAFGSPAERTILVNIVETAAYMRVQARYASAREIVVIAAPALAGALVSVSDVAPSSWRA